MTQPQIIPAPELATTPPRPARPGQLSLDARAELAARYAPTFVIHPEDASLGPPGDALEQADAVSGDYHPRSVELVLDQAHYYPGFRHYLRNPRKWFSLDRSHPFVRHLPRPLRNRFTAPPMNAEPELRQAMVREEELLVHGVLDLVDVGRDRAAAYDAWQRYFELLEDDGAQRYPRTVYARVLQGTEAIDWSVADQLGWYRELLQQHDDLLGPTLRPIRRVAERLEFALEELEQAVEELLGEVPVRGDRRDVAVQYWVLYFYNDWFNRHEVDWEAITILLRAPEGPVTPDTLEARMAAYSSHVSGRRRPWCNVELDDGRPVVYVARGSHASYFEYRPDGYAAGVPMSFKVPIFNALATTQIRHAGFGYRDHVPDPQRAPRHATLLRPNRDYQMVVLPHLNPRARLLTTDTLSYMDWLIYPGLWGDRPLLSVGGSGPRGPLWHGVMSDNPFEWVRQCTPDDRLSP